MTIDLNHHQFVQQFIDTRYIVTCLLLTQNKITAH